MIEEELFHRALERPTLAEQLAFLDEVCAGQPELRQRLERLLRSHRHEDSFLQGGVTTDEPITERPGTIIGPYKLLEQIGEGGFGVVFMAEQTEPIRRKVALKVIKPGMDTRQVIARFEAERQVLAIMDHPNIAKVLDAGTTGERRDVSPPVLPSDRRADAAPLTGRPFFVMELVKGIPITEYCDQNQLTPRERLELFIPVCQAVQHAHQKGIIHRDLKPSNVVVSQQEGVPAPKVIDFGIAKAMGQQLTDKTLYTGFAQMIGTPLYMSPEQAAGGPDIDTRSDIYSLGVLLYELLTGTTPFDKERFKEVGYDEMRRIIREEEPPKPSTRISTLGQAATTISTQRKSDPKRLSQLIRGELDWIVMKALEKDRNRRYETASAFAADVQRYLSDEPVQACPPSAGYRLRKFARRNKRALVTALLLAVMLLVTFTIAAALWVERQQRRAELRAFAQDAIDAAQLALAEQKYDLAVGRLSDARARLADAPKDLSLLAQRMEELLGEAEAKQRLQRFRQLAARARACEYFGENRQELKSSCQEALGLYNLLDASAADFGSVEALPSELRENVFELLLMLAREQTRIPDARDEQSKVALREALETFDRADRLQSGSPALYQTRAKYLWQGLGNHQAAQADLERACNAKPRTAVDHFLIGREVWQTGGRQRVDEAIDHFKAALQLQPSHFGSLLFMGRAYDTSGRYGQAELCYTACIALRPDMGRLYIFRAVLYLTNLHDPARAAADCTQVIQLPDAQWKMDAHNLRADAYGMLGRYQEAVEDVAAGYQYRKPDASPGEISYARGIGHLRFGQFQEALRAFDQAVQLAPEACENEVAWELVDGPVEIRDPEKALPLAQSAVRRDPNNNARLNTLGLVYYRLGRWKEAVETLEAASRADAHGGTASDFFILAMAHAQLKQTKEAKGYYDRAMAIAFLKRPQSIWARMPLNRLRLEAEEALKKN